MLQDAAEKNPERIANATAENPFVETTTVPTLPPPEANATIPQSPESCYETGPVFSPDSPLGTPRNLFSADAAPAAATSQTHWLYHRCCNLVQDCSIVISGLDVALHIMAVIELLRNNFPDGEGVQLSQKKLLLLLRKETVNKNMGMGYPTALFLEIAQRIDDLVNDETLTESTLRDMAG